jgi:hypothetical protein
LCNVDATVRRHARPAEAKEAVVPGVEEVKLHITASVDDIERAIVGMRGVVEQLEQAITRLRATTTGSLHPRATEALLRVEQAKQKMEEAQVLALGGIDAARAYHTIL